MDSRLLLATSLLPLLAAPALAAWADRSAVTRALIDRFVAVLLGGLVVFHIWPDAVLEAGNAALLGGLLGLGFPFLLHGRLHDIEERAFPGMVWLAFLGIVIHAALDGVALLAPEHGEASTSAGMLALAVLLHRLPTALALWWLTVPMLGRGAAVVLLAAMGLATLLGFTLAGGLFARISPVGLGIFEATVAGMLLHVVFGHHRHEHHQHAHPQHAHLEHEYPQAQASPATGRWPGILGVCAALAILGSLSLLHPLAEDEATFELLVADPSRALALSSLVVAVIAALWWSGRHRHGAVGEVEVK